MQTESHSNMSRAALISVDWGTTARRSVLLGDDGAVMDRCDDGAGILPPPRDGFAAALGLDIGAWLQRFGPLPVVMSGMIGSRQGWHEVPYIDCPADPVTIARNLQVIDAGALGHIHIVPGLRHAPSGQGLDVMRGEETQIIGALGSQDGADTGLFVLPGTHSKWAWTRNGAIAGFATYMTGEVFAALRQHTILGLLMPSGIAGRLTPERAAAFDHASFARGVTDGAADGHPGALLNRVFGVRTLGLFGTIPAAGLEAYLSGLLIGAEMAAATTSLHMRQFTIIGNAGLSASYKRCAEVLKCEARVAEADCAARGHWTIAQAAGLTKGTS